ncbi:hypothetical protein GOP47_0007806 [Adiantum capillus-veneris]|uniref:Uncharacterized protein n=1 Tax=Adiantum capillus-veneris TaxID=13818 RepID=A0A9D4V2Y2_ADICA|nr:hypothetical protein GOP47_0007806 [Adiantum capillus-veneris]
MSIKAHMVQGGSRLAVLRIKAIVSCQGAVAVRDQNKAKKAGQGAVVACAIIKNRAIDCLEAVAVIQHACRVIWIKANGLDHAKQPLLGSRICKTILGSPNNKVINLVTTVASYVSL